LLNREPNETPRQEVQISQGRKPLFWIIGVVVVIIALIGISAYAIAITPVATILTPLFWVGAVGSVGFGWKWMGVDTIPGKRKRPRGLFHSWLVVGLAFFLGVLLTYVPLVAPIGYAFFPAFVLSMAGKLAWTYGYNGRIRFCQRCATYRWFLRMDGEWYCSKKGHKWYGTDSTLKQL
jgi:hypothetical protein